MTTTAGDLGRVPVSVIVPARLAATTLATCLDAIFGSVLAPDEVIVVEDGVSVDGTGELSRLRGATVVSLPDRLGPAGARNAGVVASRGEILVFVDADVAVKPDAIGTLVSALSDNPTVDAVFGSYDTLPPRMNVASQYKNLLHHFVHQHAHEEAETFWAGLGAVRRSAFEAVGGYDAERYDRPSIEDIELGHRLRGSGRRILLVKSAQGAHLKRWLPGGVFRTDLLDRALPWTELILSTRRMPDDLNLGLRHRLGVVATLTLIVSLFGAGFDSRYFLVALAAFLGAVAAGSDLLRFFVRERGVGFALLTVPLHLLYYAASGFGFALGLVRHRPAPAESRGGEESATATALTLGLGEIVARALSFIATVHVARVVGADGFGRLELAGVLVLYASTISMFGLDTPGGLRAAADKARAGAVVTAVVGFRLLLASLSTMGLLALSLVIPELGHIRTLLLLSALVIFAEALSTAWLLQALDRVRWVPVSGILGQLLYAAGVFVFVRTSADLAAAPVLGAFGPAVASLVLGLVTYRCLRALGSQASQRQERTGALILDAAPVAFMSTVGLLTYTSDVVILGFLATSHDVGIYRAAVRLIGVFQVIGGSLAAAAAPFLIREVGSPERFRNALTWAIRFSALGWITLLAALFGTIHLFLRFTFGHPYYESLFVLRVLLVSAVVVGIRAPYRSALLALDPRARNLVPTAFAALAAVGLNILLIPRMGIRGAAVSAVVTELVLLVLVRRRVLALLRERGA